MAREGIVDSLAPIVEHFLRDRSLLTKLHSFFPSRDSNFNLLENSNSSTIGLKPENQPKGSHISLTMMQLCPAPNTCTTLPARMLIVN